MAFDGFSFDQGGDLVVGERSIDLHNVTPLRSYRYVSGHRRFELELEGSHLAYPPPERREVSVHHSLVFSYHDVRFLRIQSAPTEHVDAACFLRMRPVTPDGMRAEAEPSRGSATKAEAQLLSQVGRLFEAVEPQDFGELGLYQIDFIHGPQIVISAARITVDWQSWSHAGAP